MFCIFSLQSVAKIENSTWPKWRAVFASVLCRRLGNRDGATWHLRARIRCFLKVRAGAWFWVGCPRYLSELKSLNVPWKNRFSSQDLQHQTCHVLSDVTSLTLRHPLSVPPLSSVLTLCLESHQILPDNPHFRCQLQVPLQVQEFARMTHRTQGSALLTEIVCLSSYHPKF